MGEKFIIKPHFLYIARLLYPYLSLLIIPVVSGLARYLLGARQTLSQLLVAEAILLIIAIYLSFLKYKRYLIVFGESIYISRGLFCQLTYTIPKAIERIISVEENFILRLFGVYILKIYTDAGASYKADVSIPIKRCDALKINEALKIENGKVLKSSLASNLFMALASSSSVTGLVIAIPIVKTAASLLGKNFSSLIKTINKSVQGFESIPKILEYLVFALVVGAVVSFVILFLRNVGFNIVHSREKLVISGGILPYRRLYFNKSAITVVREVISPLMWLIRRCVVKFSACGYGLAKAEFSVLLPSVSINRAEQRINEILPIYEKEVTCLKPNKKAFLRCLFLPSIIALTGGFAGGYLCFRFKSFSSFIAFFTGVFVALCILFAIIKLVVLFIGKANFYANGFSIKCRQGLSVNCLKTENKSIEYFCIKRTPFDKRKATCKLFVKLNNKGGDRAEIPYLDYKEVKSVLK